MTELLTSAQMRAIEAAAIDSGAVTGLQLMERAGQEVVAAILSEWPELAQGGRRAVVLCGPGNNGGDGFVVARLLHGLGWRVDVHLQGDAARLPPDARHNHDLWCGIGAVRPITQAAGNYMRADVLIDALFGIGLNRPLSGQPLAALNACMVWHSVSPHAVGRIVAIDIPSGFCADSGRWLMSPDSPGPDAGFAADLTVTFHRMKTGHVLAEAAAQACGKVVVADIGLAAGFAQTVTLLDQMTLPLKGGRGRADANKFGHGHALIVSGPAGQCGAARLSARAALRIGAGLVTLACPPEAMAENAARLDAVMLRSLADAPSLARLLADARINALCIGPALGLDPARGALVAEVLAARRATVLDADALTLIARDAGLFARLHDGCILTPHGGEFARLFPDIAARLAAPATTGPAYSKVDATREAAARAGCTVLFKGADTVIAAPSGRCAINAAVYDRAAPWLATAGSGDVLAGLAAGLLARGMPPFDAACTAAWTHVEAARSFGPGLIAEDLPEALPGLFRAQMHRAP